MPSFIGRQVNLGIGKETARGTAVAPTFWIPAVSNGVEDTIEMATDEQTVCVIEGDIDAKVVKKFSQGDIEGLVRDKSFGLLLLALFGSISSALASGETIVYDHSFSVNQSVQHPSLTLALKHPAENVRFAMSMLNTLEITAELGNFVRYAVNFIGKKGGTAVDTAGYTAENQFVAQHCIVKFADDLAGLGAATPVKVKTVTLTFSKNIETDDVIGSVEPNDILNKEFRLEGSVELLYDDATYKTLALAGTKKAMRLELKNTDITLGVASNPTLQIDLAKVLITEFARSGANNDLVRQALTLTAYYSIADAKMATAKLTNETVSY